MSIYDELQPIAAELLTEFGQGVVKYVKITKGNGTVDNPGPSTRTEYTYEGATVSGAKMEFVSKQLAVASDLQIVAPVDSRFIPDPIGLMNIDGRDYKIVGVYPRPPAGTPVVNIIICRAGG